MLKLLSLNTEFSEAVVVCQGVCVLCVFNTNQRKVRESFTEENDSLTLFWIVSPTV